MGFFFLKYKCFVVGKLYQDAASKQVRNLANYKVLLLNISNINNRTCVLIVPYIVCEYFSTKCYDRV